MSMPAGHRLGPYEIAETLGRGGMGEVYRGRDTRMGRDVAVKVASEQFSDRLSREVHAIAALNHSNVCQVYDVGPNYLVMELVEGQTLAERIREGPIPLAESLRIARQIGAALEAAHEKGITHRDLKPANVKIRPDGTVKVLDFGLAKVGGPSTIEGDNSPTISLAATQAGVILGTAAYMAPEQARGKALDKRVDIWAFGVVLHEMVTGKRLFQGEDLTDTLAAVVKIEADVREAPPQLHRLLKKCLEKDPQKRLRDIGDAWDLLDEILPTNVATASSRTRRLPWALAALATAAAFAFSYLAYVRNSVESPRAERFSLLAPAGYTLARWDIPQISPDGTRVAFVAVAQDSGLLTLWLRDTDKANARLLTGAEGANFPFWSPDGRFIAFFNGRKLKKIDANGGPPLDVADFATAYRGGSWGANNVILLSTRDGGLVRVSANGGIISPATQLDKKLSETQHEFPRFLPDGHHFLYTAVTANLGKTTVYVDDVDSPNGGKDRREVMKTYSSLAYSSGYLLFVRQRTLLAQRFDADAARFTDDNAIAVAENIDYQPGSSTSLFSASADGRLIYVSDSPDTRVDLTWFDRNGQPRGVLGTPASQLWPTISPDGSTVVVERRDDPRVGFWDLWLFDLKRANPSRVTTNSDAFHNYYAVFSPDGERVAYASNRTGRDQVFQKAINGAEAEQLLDSGPDDRTPTDWSGDNKYIVEDVWSRADSDIWILPLSGDRKPYAYVIGPGRQTSGVLSPNGMWLAYDSDETGKAEIYVQSFPAPGKKRKISSDGGMKPVWSRDGKELYYYRPSDLGIWAASVSKGPNLEADPPHLLFKAPASGTASRFAVDKDGRFLALVQPPQSGTRAITLVTNWPQSLKK